MKKTRQVPKDGLRPEYKRSDFAAPLVRGKYAQRLRKSSNIVVIRPEVTAAFPNENAVNAALLSLIKVAKATARTTKRTSGRSTKRHAA